MQFEANIWVKFNLYNALNCSLVLFGLFFSWDFSFEQNINKSELCNFAKRYPLNLILLKVMISPYSLQIMALKVLQCYTHVVMYLVLVLLNDCIVISYRIFVHIRGLARLSLCVSLTALNKCLLNDLKSYWPCLWYVGEAKTRSWQTLLKNCIM